MTSLWISKHAGSQLQQKQTFKSKKISEETSNFNAKTGYFDQKKRAGQESWPSQTFQAEIISSKGFKQLRNCWEKLECHRA